MSFWECIYKIIIGPIQLLIEFLYTNLFKIVGDHGVTIILLSAAVNLLVMPFYKRAETIQREEQQRAAALKPGIEHIKKTFRGDERTMMFQTYYRQNHYSPFSILRTSFSLLLQIPFFMAAYKVLSNISAWNGVSFILIRDLSMSDGMIRLGSLSVNLLPILMTAVNVISGAIYTRGSSVRDKIQLYGMAAVFFVLLYNSPSGLVLYWLCNNVFSLVRNILGSVKISRKIRCCVFSGIGCLMLCGSVAFVITVNPGGYVSMMIMGILLQTPMVSYVVRMRRGERQNNVRAAAPDNWFFGICVALLTVLLGILIPSSIIKSSTIEFIDIFNFSSSLKYVFSCLLLAVGTFCFWCVIFRSVMRSEGKRAADIGVGIFTFCSVVNYMFFRKNYPDLSSMLGYRGWAFSYTLGSILLNTAILLVVGIIVFIIVRRFKVFSRVIAGAMVMALLVMSCLNIGVIVNEEKNYKQQLSSDGGVEAFDLDTEGKNVVVIMLDRAISSFIPFIFHEHPELKQQFEGFVWYPNTLSYGSHTNTAAPALFGGYEYTSLAIDLRSDESLESKHNEALKIMPYLFDDAGYSVTIYDPAYAGYQWIPDLSIYDERPSVKAFLLSGRFGNEWLTDHSLPGTESAVPVRMRNFAMHSVFRAAPLFMSGMIYDQSKYCDCSGSIWGSQVSSEDDVSHSSGFIFDFVDAYSILDRFESLTNITHTGQNTFMMMCNYTTHENCLLSEPDYSVSMEIDNTEYDSEHTVRYDDDGNVLRLTTFQQMSHYHVNTAALLRLGQWLDYLRDNGVYDNTRIIIVADHGRSLGLGSILYRSSDVSAGPIKSDYTDVSAYNPLLLVKDFDSTDDFKTDTTFMTNADTPLLALSGIVDEPVNPFTGNALTDAVKHEDTQYVIYCDNWSVSDNNGNVFEYAVVWSRFRGSDIWDLSSWEYAGSDILPEGF